MQKYYLMAPGPSMIPERVLLEMAKPIIHHRTKAFEELFAKVRAKLKDLYQTKNDVVVLASVGSGAMEAAIVNSFSKGDKIVAVRCGKFGERWSDQAKRFGLDVIDLNVTWGEAVTVAQIEKVLNENPGVKGLLCQACETSTGVSNPIKDIGLFLKQKHPQVLFCVDAITALGIYDIRTDEWGLDLVVSGSQKALMLPPGLAFLSVSEKAKKAFEKSDLPKFYFDLKEEMKMQAKNQTHFTPAISLISGLNESLSMIFEEGLPALFARHKKLAEATRQGILGLGLELYSKAPSDSITAVIAPKGVDGEAVVKNLKDWFNISIIGGQDSIKGKVFRLGHMGYCGDFDILSLIGALELTLSKMGIPVGSGVSSVQKALSRFSP